MRASGAIVSIASVALVGCVSPERAERADADEDGAMPADGESEEGPTDDGVDAQTILDRAFDYASELQRVNAMPELGTHGDAATINYFAAPENVQLFLTIDPERTDQNVGFIEGSMFLKEHFDDAGEVIGFTVMYKGPPGYNPEGGDWFWARVNEGTVSHQGQVGFCVDCHVMVESTDYVYGVPLDNRL